MADPFEGIVSDPLTSLSINTSPATPEDLMKDTVPAMSSNSNKLTDKKKYLILTELRAKGLSNRESDKVLMNVVKIIESNIE